MSARLRIQSPGIGEELVELEIQHSCVTLTLACY